MGSADLFSNDYTFTTRVTVIIIVGFISFATIAVFVVCLLKYSPCCSDYLRRRNINLPFHRQSINAPCVSCQLIEMGEMACYNGICSGCGRVPPSIARATFSVATTKHV